MKGETVAEVTADCPFFTNREARQGGTRGRRQGGGDSQRREVAGIHLEVRVRGVSQDALPRRSNELTIGVEVEIAAAAKELLAASTFQDKEAFAFDGEIRGATVQNNRSLGKVRIDGRYLDTKPGLNRVAAAEITVGSRPQTPGLRGLCGENWAG